MISLERYGIEFYQALGKLFYAIAAVDNHVKEVEFNKLKELINTEWILTDNFNMDGLRQIKIVFDWLHKHDKLQSEKWFNDFVQYKNNNEDLFTSEIKQLILKTANAIISSFSKKNKSELILLAKLHIEFKKVTHEK